MKKIVLWGGLAIAFAAPGAAAQTTDGEAPRRVNFGYSQNPKTKPKKESAAPTNPNPAVPTNTNTSETAPAGETIASKTLGVVRTAARKALAPTEHYRVGAGDILFINLQNSSKGSTLYTVLNDGTIDYPLAGEMVSVEGLTTDEIEEVLSAKIKLFENPQVSVTVRDYASHKITVLGLVEKSGDKFIQREAVPLFVVRAEALVAPAATRALVRRATGKTETIELKDEQSDALLVFPGDIVEFTSDQAQAAKAGARFVFIGGEVAAGGQKDFFEGLTLTQAILAAGGLKKDGVKKVVVRRRSEAGLLVATEYNLKQIKDGKAPDPALAAGDTIEVGN